ncbi:MAG: ABC transporter ATP-binding protein [Nocardioidaceae bacterium]|nr:ABC transporter ATP-binding protein [Nocardioidaceae bacterium]
MTGSTPGSGALVELSGVGLEIAHPVRTRILQPTDLEIVAGESVAIVGPSGAGKTTLASIIGTLQSPSEGSYRFAGQEMVGKTRKELARFRAGQLGFVFQQAHLVEYRTARANVELGLTDPSLNRAGRRELSMEALRRVGLHRLGERLAAHLSGGEQQRVAIARALVKAPSLVIADEPTSALDQRTGQAILELLAGVGTLGATLVLVTHDERAMGTAGRVVTIVDGGIRP